LSLGLLDRLRAVRAGLVQSVPVEPKDVGDRQLDALLERLDRIADELERLNRITEKQDGFALVAREVRELTESMNALAYAALGQTPPRVRRRAG